jgi:C_GCAxxG_C_C family probable redox protein
MQRIEAAVASFQSGFSCSQAVLAAYADLFGMDRETAVRIAAGFGGGMGRMANTCGAVTGALMVLGLKYGATDATDRQAKEAVYERVREFSRRFAARHGSTVCRDLLGCDISTPAGVERARQGSLFTSACPKFVQSAAEILEELLAT